MSNLEPELKAGLAFLVGGSGRRCIAAAATAAAAVISTTVHPVRLLPEDVLRARQHMRVGQG